MTGTKAAAYEYRSGHCSVGGHDRCQGVYAGCGCCCDCHHELEPEPEPVALRIGSLFSGYGGLEEGVQSVLGGTVAWHSEIDPGACKILAHRYPDVPNLGDITTVDWASVEPVDVLTGGSPCQDVSAAGKRLGMRAGTRSGLWASMCDAIDIIRPGLVVWENVRGVLSAGADSAVEPCPICVGDERDSHLRALGRVVGDLAELGYVGRWTGLRAADVGAPHGRFRVFVVAWPADAASDPWRLGDGDGRPAADAHGERAGSDAGGGGSATFAGSVEWPQRWSEPGSLVSGCTPADSGRLRGDTGRLAAPGQAQGGRALPLPGERRRVDAAADSPSDGRHEGRPEPARLLGGPDAALRGDAAAHADRDALRQQPVALTGCGGASLAGHAGPDAPADTSGLGRPGRQQPRQDVEQDGSEPAHAGAPRRTPVDWGAYGPAVHRWERCLGRPAPSPTERGRSGQPRLSPAFVEFLMGLPAGWVTDVPGLGRNEQLKALGNGVVPQQAAVALRMLLADVAAPPASVEVGGAA